MICQRCGNCCVTMDVVIPVVHIDPERPLGLRAMFKPGGMRCPNLLRESDGQLRCAVHHIDSYVNSPCWTYGNSQVDPDFICKRGKPCPVGTLYQQRGGYPVPDPPTELLEDLGPWKF